MVRGNYFFKACFLLKISQAFGLLNFHALILSAPAIIRDLVHAQPTDHFTNAQTVGRINCDFPQLQYDFLGRLSLPRHASSPLVQPFYCLNVAAQRGRISCPRLNNDIRIHSNEIHGALNLCSDKIVFFSKC